MAGSRQPVVRRLWRSVADRDPMTVGVLVSLVLHAGLLAVRFGLPLPAERKAVDSRLEVVLLNARSEQQPRTPEVRAQVDMTGGGDRASGRARSPLEAADRDAAGADVATRRRRVEAFVEQQRRLLTGAGASRPMTASEAERTRAQGAVAGVAEEDVDRALARLQAQLDQRLADDGNGLRRRTFGVDAVGVSYARYVDEWAGRVERLGTEHYPEAARGRAYDAMLVTVEIDRHGNVVDIVLHNRSRHEVLNRAVRRIVLAGAPYRKFSPEMAREGDVLQIVRVWNFTNDALATRSADAP